MKPIMLHGHERSITQLKTNREGDLLFSAAKDPCPNVWYTLNGERLGTFKGHTGAVWCIDVNWDSTKVLTGSADNSCKLWDCQTGKEVINLTTRSAVRTCGFSYSGQMIFHTNDKAMGQICELSVFDTRDDYQMSNNSPYMVCPINKSKVTSAIWGPIDETIVTGHENGDLMQWDIKSGDPLRIVSEHSKQINDIQTNKDMTLIVTASKDNTSKLFDMQQLEFMKTYKTERPVNSASISPIKPHVVLGGGQDAMDVTTTSTKIGKFDARLYHLIFEEEFARVKGHFGPINSCVFHPDGKGYSSGGEDGYIRVHQFDAQYYDFEVEY